MSSDDSWASLTSFENLLNAFRRASRGKRYQPAVAKFEFHLEEELFRLQDELQSGHYSPGDYNRFYVHEGKRRLISAAPFRDRVVHHALMGQMEPLIDRKLIYDCYANRREKGTHKALDRCTHFMRRFRYVLPLDVVQFFPSIDHAILRAQLGSLIESDRIMALCAMILEAGSEELAAEYDMVHFDGDNLFAILRPRGLPIGNLTSQHWANFYLNGLDHFIKRTLKCRGYLRYMDDMLLFSDSKRNLLEWRRAVIKRLATLRLIPHVNCAQTHHCQQGIPFLGFYVFPDHRRLRRRNVVDARRRLRQLHVGLERGSISFEQMDASVQGWINHARYGDTWGLRRSIFETMLLAPSSGGGNERS